MTSTLPDGTKVAGSLLYNVRFMLALVRHSVKYRKMKLATGILLASSPVRMARAEAEASAVVYIHYAPRLIPIDISTSTPEGQDFEVYTDTKTMVRTLTEK